MTTTAQTQFPPRRLRGLLELTLILAAGLLIYGWKLGDAPLNRTEPHRALVGHQMVQSGQWLIPKLFGETYLRKPPLIYWIEGGAERLVGHAGEWVWRLPSAVGSAVLAVVLAAWSARWFGSLARLPAGIACLSLIPLWEQNRGADIDALNTVTSVITAMMVLEVIGVGGRRGRGAAVLSSESSTDAGRSSLIWTLGFGLSLGATLLLKGPGGFPPLLGALIGSSLLLRNWGWAKRPNIWVGLIIGIAMFAGYGVAAKAEMHRQGLPSDTGGVREAMQRLLIHRWNQILPAAGAPFVVLMYSIPVSLVAVFAVILVRGGRALPDAVATLNHRRFDRKIIALLGTIAVALLVWVLAGNDNPRYEYVALPLLAPLVGAVAVAWREGRFTRVQQSVMRFVLAGTGGLWAGLAIVVAGLIWKQSSDHAGLIVAIASAAAAGTASVVAWLRSKYAVGGLAITLAILSLAVPLADRKNLDRQRRSARNVAAQLRNLVQGQQIRVASLNRDMPEMFYYADLPVRAFGERGLDKLAATPGGQWVVLTQNKIFPEYGTLTSQIHDAFPHGVTRLNMPNPKDLVYVGWYEPPAGSPRVVRLPSVNPAEEQATDE